MHPNLPAPVAKFCAFFGHLLTSIFWSAGSLSSLASLLTALAIGVGYLLWRRGPGRRIVRLAVLRRALFPHTWWAGPSARADIGFFLFNTMAAGAMFGWAIVSFATIRTATNALLTHAFGPPAPAALPQHLAPLIATLALFLAYEFGYWVDHYIKHHVPFLWEFHKVHHTAQTLSPVTVYRMHPIDSVVFYNILALTTGATYATLHYAWGDAAAPFAISGTNIVLLAFGYVVIHLQHTHIWLPIRGIWGRILLSPAHHQIHHSDNPTHFGTNLGSCLSVFDTMFGTLSLPPAKRPHLRFGISPAPVRPHSVTGGLITPFVAAFGVLRPQRAVRIYFSEEK